MLGLFAAFWRSLRRNHAALDLCGKCALISLLAGVIGLAGSGVIVLRAEVTPLGHRWAGLVQLSVREALVETGENAGP